MSEPYFDALVMAGTRRGGRDPVALHAGVSNKCLVDVCGRPMISRVLEALAASPHIRSIAISIEDPQILLACDELSQMIDQHHITFAPSGSGPALSVLKAIEGKTTFAPLLVTTADSALLTRQIVDCFCAEARTGQADLSVGFAARTCLHSAYPEVRRTYLRFRDDRYSGCNLYAFSAPDSLKAAAFWAEADRLRKQPFKLVARFGLGSLALFALNRLTLRQALARAGNKLGLTAAPVILPFAHAAMDVDKADDLALARAILTADTNQAS